MVNYYIGAEAKVSQSIQTLSSKEQKSRFEKGSLALLKAEQTILQHRVVSLHNSFKHCVEIPAIDLPCMVTSDIQSNEDDVLSCTSNAELPSDTDSDYSMDDDLGLYF